MSMANLLVYGIISERKRSDVEDGVKAMVWMYYDNFTDAVELEPEFVGRLRSLATNYLAASFDEDDIDAAIRYAETELRDEGRKVHTALCDDPTEGDDE